MEAGPIAKNPNAIQNGLNDKRKKNSIFSEIPKEVDKRKKIESKFKVNCVPRTPS